MEEVEDRTRVALLELAAGDEVNLHAGGVYGRYRVTAITDVRRLRISEGLSAVTVPTVELTLVCDYRD